RLDLPVQRIEIPPGFSQLGVDLQVGGQPDQLVIDLVGHVLFGGKQVAGIEAANVGGLDDGEFLDGGSGRSAERGEKKEGGQSCSPPECQVSRAHRCLRRRLQSAPVIG